MEENIKDTKQFVAFGANFEPYLEINKVLPTEVEIRGKNFIGWGDNNDYPVYLYTLFNEVATLRTLLNSVCDYVCGDNIISSNEVIISQDDIADLVYDIALSYAIYGGFAIQVLRNKLGNVCKLVVLDMRYVRSSKKGDYIYYSEDFGKHSFGRCKALCYPAYDSQNPVDSSVFFYKNEKFNVYPQPVHVASVIACEMERKINEYHLNSLCNGFVGSVLVNMNNGKPEDEQQQEIVDAFEEKFTGTQNAGRVIVSFNDSKENAAELLPLNTEDFGEKYKTLIARSQSQIYAAWRCTPNLVGVPTETTGFNSQEYTEAFKLFQRTVIAPIQKQIVKTINKLFEGQLEVTIDPFTIDFENNTKEDIKNITEE